MHGYYHREGSTDLGAIRQEALRRLNDSRWPEESIIHYHSKEENRFCLVTAPDDQHEVFRFPEQKATAEEQGMDAVRKDMEADILKSWNDQDHDQ